MEKLRKQVSIITGAGKGIGKGIANCFAQEGSSVVIATRDAAEGRQVEEELQASGKQATFIETDVLHEDSIKNMVNQTIEKYGKIDTLVNNAGITRFIEMQESTLEDWEQVINIDLRGTFLCSKYVLPHMKSKRKGSIINISSNHTVATLPHSEIYAAAKGGVNAMTKSMALSLGEFGIRANVICPGFTDTPHYQEWLQQNGNNKEGVEDQIHKLHALGKICKPADVGLLAVYLASEDSSMMTGESIVLDGGLSARLYHADD